MVGANSRLAKFVGWQALGLGRVAGLGAGRTGEAGGAGETSLGIIIVTVTGAKWVLLL